MNGYPKLFLKLLMLTFAVLWLSGILLYPSMAVFKLEWEYDWLMDSGLASGSIRQTFTTLHAIAGWLMVWFIGTLWTIHLRTHWRRYENRKSGSLFSFSWLILTLSALGIYYFGNQEMSYLSTLIHALVGLIMPLLLVQHVMTGRKVIGKR